MNKKKILAWIIKNMPLKLYKMMLKKIKGINPPHNWNKSTIKAINLQLFKPQNLTKVERLLYNLSQQNFDELSDEDTFWLEVLKNYQNNELEVAFQLIEEHANKVDDSKSIEEQNETKKIEENVNLREDKKIKKLVKRTGELNKKIENLKNELKERTIYIKEIELENRKYKFEKVEYDEEKKSLINSINELNSKITNEKKYSYKIKAQNETLEKLNEELSQKNKLLIGELKRIANELKHIKEDNNKDKKSKINILQIGLPNNIKHKQLIEKLKSVEIISSIKDEIINDHGIKIKRFSDPKRILDILSQNVDKFEKILIYKLSLDQKEEYIITNIFRERSVEYVELNTNEEFENIWS